MDAPGLAAPAHRDAGPPDWRSLAFNALAAPAVNYDMWLLGTLSFCLRGGALIVLAPILVLPTQVEVRILLGGNLGSSGLTSGFWTLLALATLTSAVITLAVLHGLARIEARAFTSLLADQELLDEAGIAMPPRVVAAALVRRSPVAPLFVIEAVTLIALLLLGVPLAASIGQATLDEILRPSSGTSIFLRVLGDVAPILAVTALVVPVVDSLSALTAREVLLGSSLRHALPGALAQAARSPRRTLATAATGWLVLAVVLLAVSWALSVAWQSTRTAFLSTTSIADLLQTPEVLIVGPLLAAVFVAGLGLAGFVAAFRASLWTLNSLRS